MKITFRSEGGIAYFPGLARPVTLDLGELPDVEARRIKQLIADADFFALKSQDGAGRRPDVRTFHITVEEGGRAHTASIAEPIGDIRLQELVRVLEMQVRSARRKIP